MFTWAGALVSLRSVDLIENENWYAQISLLTENGGIFHSFVKSFMRFLLKPCRFPQKILTEDKVKSYLHGLALPDIFSYFDNNKIIRHTTLRHLPLFTSF